MKTLIHIKVPRDGQAERACKLLNEALGVKCSNYLKTFNLSCGEQLIEHVIAGGLREQSGIWYVKNEQFPAEDTYFFNRIKNEVDCLLIVRQDTSNQLRLEIVKARMTSLEPGDSFVLPRSGCIVNLIKPYNFLGSPREEGQEQ